MSEIDLELLITLDEPDGAPEEDTFNHSSAENTPEVLARSATRESASTANKRKPAAKMKYGNTGARHFGL
jgi:hypothetical protein